MALANAIALSSARPASVTSLNKPILSAVSASIISPLSSMRMAALGPTARVRATAGVVQKSPMFTPGVAKRAAEPAAASPERLQGIAAADGGPLGGDHQAAHGGAGLDPVQRLGQGREHGLREG